MNPRLVEEIADHLRSLRDESMTFLVIEHHMDLVNRLCDPVIVMAESRRLTEVGCSSIAVALRVQEAYIGVRKAAA